MSTALVPSATLDPATVQMVLLSGDLSRLTPEQRTSYYNAVCQSVGLNPLTQPFEYLKLQGKEKLYARKDATDQLRFIHGVSVRVVGREIVEGIFVVTSEATMPNGRTDTEIGAVPIDGQKGEARANAMMKAMTKSKRRATLSICGLGMLDETEVDSIPGAVVSTTPRPALPETSATPSPGVLVSELPEPAAPPTRGRRAPSAPVAAPAAGSGNSGTPTTVPVVILNTQFSETPAPHYVITVQETDEQPFEPARSYDVLTAKKELYDIAAKAEGTGQIFDATWHTYMRPNNVIGKSLDALEAV